MRGLNMTFLRSKQQAGLSMVELLVAMVLGLFLIGGVIQLFVSSKATYRVQEGLSRVQEAGRYAIEHLTADIRSAGYIGCGNLDRVPLNVIADDPPTFSPSTAIVGYDAGSGWTNPTTITLEPGTDVVWTRRASDASLRLTGNMLTDDANIQVLGNRIGASAGDALFITDCVNADLFRATTVSAVDADDGTVTISHAEDSNDGNRLSKPYRSDAEVMAFMERTYFVGRANAGDPPSLYVYDGAQTLQLISGVEDFQVQYGVDSDGDYAIDSYSTAGGVTDWTEVRSVRLALLIASGEEVKEESESVAYSVLGNSVTTNDRQLRQVFGSDIALRNRLY